MQIKLLSEINIELFEYNKNINYDCFRKIVTDGRLECIYKQEKTIFTCNKNESQYTKNIILLSKEDFTQLMILLYRDFIVNFCLNTRKKHRSVKYFNTKKYKKYCYIMLILMLLTLNISSIYLKFLIIFYYIICTTSKSILLFYSILSRKEEKLNTIDISKKQKLPKYTILVPMFRENETTILQLINSIKSLEYPKDLLDVKIVLEDDDKQTRKILKNISLPTYIIPIWVPYFEPRTKPKACNVGALFATGDILVIFDSEDIPNTKQLIYAVNEFNKNKNVQILQGNLNFYNYNENLLTHCFNIEYSIWFNFMLKILSKMKITIPLGGTSNHIRCSYLGKLYWDSYNVTEDLELSVICDENNQQIKHLNIETKEWCVINFNSFIKQRSRWIKGYLLTYFTHFTNYNIKNVKKLIFFHIIVGFSGLSYLLIPILTLCLFKTQNQILLNVFTIVNLVYYFINIYIILILKQEQNISNLKKIIIITIYPLYFILHIYSAWKAFFEIFNKPFYWSKTEHLNKN